MKTENILNLMNMAAMDQTVEVNLIAIGKWK